MKQGQYKLPSGWYVVGFPFGKRDTWKLISNFVTNIVTRFSLFSGFSTSLETGNFQKNSRESREIPEIPKILGIPGNREIPGNFYRA